MPEKTQKLELPNLLEARANLESVETQAKASLGNALTEAGVSTTVAEQYTNLFPEPANNAGEVNGKFSLAILGKKAWEEVRENRLTQLILGGLVTATAARIAETHGVISPQIPVAEEVTILLDNLLKWSGSGAKSPLDVLSILNSLGSAMVYVGVPAKAVEFISAAQGRVISEKVRKQTEAMKIRGEEEQAIKEGRAYFDGKVGPNIQIDVGKSDPAMRDLLTLFHAGGLRVVSYWDSENKFFDIDPAWQKTKDDWTNREPVSKLQ